MEVKSPFKPCKAPGSARKDPHCQKENCSNSPFEKRRKITCRDTLGSQSLSESRTRVRLALTIRQETSPVNQSPKDGSPASNVSMQKDEDRKLEIEDLLNMKMSGKTKYDFKGKSEQMMEYIKKLRACIRQLQDCENKCSEEKKQIEDQLIRQRKDHKEAEAILKAKQQELEEGLLELRQMCSALEVKLTVALSEKEALNVEKERDGELLKALAEEKANLLEEVGRVQNDISNLNQQVGSLQDLNRRLQEYNTSLQQYNSKLQKDASSAAEAISRVQNEKSAIMETLSTLRGHSAAIQEQLDISKTAVQDGLRQKKDLLEEVDRVRRELQRVLDERNQYCAQECLSSQTEQVKELNQQLETANKKLQVLEAAVLHQSTDGAEYLMRQEELQNRLAEAELRLKEGELLRRKLHNTIQELKGNIRVFCRVRPLLQEDEQCDAEPPVVLYPTSTELLGRGVELFQSQGPRYSFTFDKVFSPEAGQEEVFSEISQLIQSALDGYKVCIFAYGQTGSGKTHTMLGNPDLPDERGVIPRSLEQIFKSSQEFRSKGWSFRLQASMLEIYNETIRDLLSVTKCSNTDGVSAKQYVVKHDQNGNTFVSDLTLIDVTNWKEVSSLLRRAAQSRSVGKTALNEQSSRSHCVFTLRISGINASTEQEVQGVLNLIDLAGSERLSRSGSTGDRLKETQAINKSLSSLGDVIVAIANKDQHIPYRNSKLTYLLQPCLGGDSKTLMFVNISPDSKSLHESLCSLRFAAKVNACEIGVPRRHTSTHL
ncbi:hypothetical protein O6H91_18G082900 [Diphasiastrum complanatum]|uniref:Uncharacterized protein n=1 Tax=Diphasiastrum complanatum TaxID=34168 RepID=A0ACC2B384_DIPCM|nr:hypothetical protein O6H91_18G082900 [Diphasiastrum complanatum]